MPKKILTIANCGTNFDEDSGDVVARLATYLTGKRYDDWLIFAGPGSIKATDHYYNPIKAPEQLGILQKASKTVSYVYDKGYYKVKGLSAGEGMELNTGFLVEFLDGMKSYERPDIINMFGWSRGACTCVMMAHAINEKMKKSNWNIEVNIFAIDPVPGPGNFVTEIVEVPACVKFCTVIQMENESRPAMIGARLRVASKFSTFLQFLRFPGSHSSGLTASNVEEKMIKNVIAYLCHTFLTQRGTKFTAGFDETPESLCLAYAEMILNQEYYLSLGAVDRLLADEDKYYNLGHYLKHDDYFINESHAAMFKSAYMPLYNHLFKFGSINEHALEQLTQPRPQGDGLKLIKKSLQENKGPYQLWDELPSEIQKSIVQCKKIKKLASKLKNAVKATSLNTMSWMTDITVTANQQNQQVSGKLKTE